MKWHIEGADSESGKDVNVDFEASNEKDALLIAKGRGIFVQKIIEIPESPAPAFSAIKPTNDTKSIWQQYRTLIALIVIFICVAVYFGYRQHAKTLWYENMDAFARTSSKIEARLQEPLILSQYLDLENESVDVFKQIGTPQNSDQKTIYEFVQKVMDDETKLLDAWQQHNGEDSPENDYVAALQIILVNDIKQFLTSIDGKTRD